MLDTDTERLEDRSSLVETLLLEVDATGKVPRSILDAPGAFLREFYEVWVENGGKISGRYNRNSLTRMNNEWLKGARHVKSLHPKLIGQVTITKSDATSLIHLFLERWSYSPPDNPKSNAKENDAYVAFPVSDINSLTKTLVETLFSSARDAGTSGIRIPLDSLTNIPLDEQESLKKYTDQCLRSEAIINLSRHKSIIGPNTLWKMRTFWKLMDKLFEADSDETPSDFTLIWVVDIGSRIVEDDDSFRSFSNVGFLAMQFVALATFQLSGFADERTPLYRQMSHPDRRARIEFWDWIQKRAVIIVQNLQEEEYADYYNNDEKKVLRTKFVNTGTTADQILPNSIPSKWSKKIREIYGRDAANLNEATITALINKSDNYLSSKVNYYAVAQIDQHDRTSQGEPIFRQTELGSPGQNYDDAMRIVKLASRYVINRQDGRNNTPNEEEETAFGYLASTGFQTLSLRDFIQIYWSGVDLLQTHANENSDVPLE